MQSLEPVAKQARLEVLPAVAATMDELRIAAENLNELITDLKRDPQELIQGRSNKP